MARALAAWTCSWYAVVEFSLRRDGTAGVCGVWGDRGLLGDEDADIEAGLTMPGTLASWRLELLDERCSCDEAMESDKTTLDSSMPWNLESWVTLVAGSPRLPGSKLRSDRLLSSTFKNSDILSSSV
jgi:hypothetical protein